MENKWQCQFKKPPKQITVGQKLLMLCEGDTASNVKPPLRIEFLDKQQLYSLHVLKTLKQEENFLALEVSSYRTGEFNSPFIITDGKKELFIEGFSFSVQSVLNETKQPAQPHGPFGPFKFSLPLWYWFSISMSLVFLFLCIFIFLNRLLKRKKFIQKVLKRKAYLSPSKFFTIGLRKQKENSFNSLKDLENLFKIFLEDLFFIPAINQTREQIMRNLKKYQYQVYKKEGQNLRQALNEFSSLQGKTIDNKSFFKLKKICQDIAFLLDKKKRGKLNELAHPFRFFALNSFTCCVLLSNFFCKKIQRSLFI